MYVVWASGYHILDLYLEPADATLVSGLDRLVDFLPSCSLLADALLFSSYLGHIPALQFEGVKHQAIESLKLHLREDDLG